MIDVIQQILERPRQQKIGILVGLVILPLGLYYSLLYSSLSSQLSRVTEDIENARMDKERKNKRAANLPKLQQELKEADGMLKEAVAQLPDRKEIPDLLSNISTKARGAGLEIMMFRPKEENFQEFYAEIPVDIVVRGSFHRVVTFFDEVGRFSRLVNVQNIEMKTRAGNDGQSSVETSAQAITFRFLNEAERKKVAEEKAKAAKKKK
jgi:type IV pilus assembly protein PilO